MDKRTAKAAAIATFLGAVIAAAAASPAHASTSGCTGGVYAGYCGTQTDQEASALSWDVFHQGRTAGTKIIGYPDGESDPATDFFTFAYDGGSAKVFEYAPNGVASNLCISEPNSHAGLVLRWCNGSPWQRFTAAPATAGFTWQNAATGDIVQANGKWGQLTGVTAPATLTAQQEWTFAS